MNAHIQSSVQVIHVLFHGLSLCSAAVANEQACSFHLCGHFRRHLTPGKNEAIFAPGHPVNMLGMFSQYRQQQYNYTQVKAP